VTCARVVREREHSGWCWSTPCTSPPASPSTTTTITESGSKGGTTSPPDAQPLTFCPARFRRVKGLWPSVPPHSSFWCAEHARKGSRSENCWRRTSSRRTSRSRRPSQAIRSMLGRGARRRQPRLAAAWRIRPLLRNTSRQPSSCMPARGSAYIPYPAIPRGSPACCASTRWGASRLRHPSLRRAKRALG
jgi:hypothetical protein